MFAAMGSGKTVAVLMATQGARLLDEGPVLVLAPRRVARNVWPSEARKWDNINARVIQIKGTPVERARALKREAEFYTVNYEQLPWLVDHLKDRWPFRTIIADESTRLKGMRLNQGGQRTKALSKIAWLPEVERFIELTGTPAPNGLKDLWGQMWFLDRGKRLGRTYDEGFMRRWFRPSRDGYGVEPFDHSQDQIQERIADLCITIDPRDYIDIAEPIEHIIEVELPPKAREQYREMEKKMFLELQHALGTHEVEAVHAAARTNKCLQIAAGFVYHEGGEGFTELHSAKLEALESAIEDANGMPVLVSYMFRQEFAMMRRHFPQIKHIEEVDTTPEGAWNKGKVPLMATHPASAGHGENLQWGSNILVDFSSGWNLEYDDQIIERIGPMRQYQAGLNRPVYRYRIEAVDTADEMVRERRITKRSVQEILLEAMKRKGLA